jgi:hypothetical protein
MLTAIGESPINQLGGATTVDADIAEQTLDQVSRDVQSIGWHFNTDKEFPLVRDMDNKIPVTDDIVRIDVSKYDYPSVDATQRGSFLYDRKNHTYEFSTDLTGEVVRIFDWTYLPQPFRSYITIKAARILQTKMVGSDTLHNQLAADELSALSILKEFEADTADYSIFDVYDVASVLDR